MNKAVLILFTLLCLNSFFGVCTNSYKVDYYKAFSSSDTILINNQLKVVLNSKFAEKEAYMGALLMKKAGLLNSIKDKSNLFKKGKQLLENAISKEKQNAEYRFLRIAIQENCPLILMYNKNIDEDKQIVKQYFNILETEIKNAITDYCKTSNVIKLNEL